MKNKNFTNCLFSAYGLSELSNLNNNLKLINSTVDYEKEFGINDSTPISLELLLKLEKD